jgi:glutaconate CoA-transferase, subunit B
VEYRREELLACVIAGLIGDARHAAVGAASPIPATACALLRAAGAPLRVSLQHKRRGHPFTEGSRELFDLAGQGRIDVFFLGGAQIDGEANINLVKTTEQRFPGSFGSAFMYFTAKRTILFREEHSPRTLVRKVEFVSAPGWSPPELERPGGPVALVTGKALFSWQKDKRRFRLESVHPGHDARDIARETGFEYELGPQLRQTAPPSQEQLRLLRGPVARVIAPDYPDYAKRVWPDAR